MHQGFRCVGSELQPTRKGQTLPILFNRRQDMALVDSYSYTHGTHPVIVHAALAFYLDFGAFNNAPALITLSAPHTGDLPLDHPIFLFNKMYYKKKI